MGFLNHQQYVFWGTWEFEGKNQGKRATNVVVTVVEAGECFVQRSANRIGQICEGARGEVVILGSESHCHSLYQNFPS